MGKKKSQPSPLVFALKGSNILVAGGKANEAQGVLEVVYSGWKLKLDNVTVALIEIDDKEPLDPAAAGEDKTLAKFTGSIDNQVFTAASSELLTDKLPDTAPHIKVSIGTKDPVKVKLPDADNEGGLFELGVVVTSGKSSYRSTWRAYARHYTIAPAEGPVLAFITGADASADPNHRYFGAATAYWKAHADAVLVKDGMSLEEIIGFLARHREGYGEYGAINIVGHGSRLHAALRIVNGGEKVLRLKTLYETLGVEGKASANPKANAVQKANADKFAYTAAQLGLGTHSRVVFCACNIGNRPDLLKAIRKYIFADGCTVHAPKYLQAYSTADFITGKEVAPFAYFSEDLERHVAVANDPDRAAQEQLIRPLFAAAHPRLSFDAERASYTARVSPSTGPYTWPGWESTFFDFSKNAVKTDAQLSSEMQRAFDQQRDEDWKYTRWNQWRVDSIAREDVTANGRIVTSDNIWVTISGDDAVPAQSFASPSGGLYFGSDSTLGQPPADHPTYRPPGVTLPDPSVAPVHAKLSTPKAPRVAIQAEGDGKNSFTVDKPYRAYNGKVPLSFSIGPYSISLRLEHKRLATAQLSRKQVSWRRPLRQDDEKVVYGKDRKLVTPDLTNTSHYGSSDDPIPTPEQLARLFE